MDTKKTSKIITYVIYALIITLSIMLLYNFYLIYKNISTPSVPPKNSVRVSPLTGEEITTVSYTNNIIKVIYDSNANEYGGLSNASIIFEDNINGTKIVSALFMEYDLVKDSSMKIISKNYSSNLPNINFISTNDTSKYYTNDIGNINIIRKDSLTSKFLFFNNQYHHFTSDKEDIDTVNSKEITYSNIVVNISLVSPDTLLIFSGGKARKSSINSDLYLLQGKTYWITLDTADSVETSNDKIQESLN